jgi:hypothetical protein
MSAELYRIRTYPLREDIELKAYIHDRLEPFGGCSNHYDITNLHYGCSGGQIQSFGRRQPHLANGICKTNGVA